MEMRPGRGSPFRLWRASIFSVVALSIAAVCFPAQPAQPQTSNRPVIGKHKVPIRFVPMKQARKLYKGFHPSDVPDSRIVAGVLVVDASLVVWQSEYDHHAGGKPGRRIIVVPYASQPKDRGHTLRVNNEQVEITFPYNPKKLNGRFQPVTLDLKGVLIKASAYVRIYGDIEVKMEARSTRGRQLDCSYWTTYVSGSQGALQPYTLMGELRKDGTVHVKGKLSEIDGPGHRETYLFHLIFRTKP